MKFDLLTDGQEIKLPSLRNSDFYSHCFVCLVHISLLLSLFGDGFIQFQDNKVSLKQVPGHNHENMIFQLGQCPFNLYCYVLFA